MNICKEQNIYTDVFIFYLFDKKCLRFIVLYKMFLFINNTLNYMNVIQAFYIFIFSMIRIAELDTLKFFICRMSAQLYIAKNIKITRIL